MKKFVVLSLVGLMIMAFGATSYAQVDFKAYGWLTAGFINSRNIGPSNTGSAVASYWNPPFYPKGSGYGPWWPPFVSHDSSLAYANDSELSGAWNRPVNFFSQWSCIFFEWNVGKEIKGVFNIETVSYHSGTNTINRNFPADFIQTIQGAEFDTGLWDTRVGQTRLRQAYVSFGLPYFGIPVPMNLMVGIIPMAIRPPFMWLTTNGAGIQFDMKPDPLAISFTWAKMAEGKIAVADDSNHFSLEARAKVGPANIGGYTIFQTMNTYPIVYNETPYGYPSSNYEADFWWFGGYADAKVGPINLNLDLAFDTGKVKGRDSAGYGSYKDVKYRGWSGQVKATYPWDKFAFGAVLSYFSGADLKKTSLSGLPGANVANSLGAGTSRKVGAMVYPAGSAMWVAWGESMFLGGHAPSTAIAIPQGMPAAGWNTQVTRGATGGTWIAKLFGSAQLTPWYKVTLWGLYIGDTTKNGNSFGDAVNYAGYLRDDKTIGWELALVQDISIYKNLTLSIGSGMLFAGDALDQKIAGTNLNKSPKNPYMLSTKLNFVF